MSDPRHAHAFDPNRHGYCKTIVGAAHCGLGVDAPVHTRYLAALARGDRPTEGEETPEQWAKLKKYIEQQRDWHKRERNACERGTEEWRVLDAYVDAYNNVLAAM